MKFLLSFSILSVLCSVQIGECRQPPQLGRSMREEFFINPDYVQINHGAFGTYPKAVSRALHAFQERCERNPDLWLRREAKTELAKVRKLLADLISADPEDVVLVPNTTSGLNAIIRSMVFRLGERVLYLSTIFNGLNSLVQYMSDMSPEPISRVVFNITYPMSNSVFLRKFETFLETNHDPERPIRLAMIDHISSPTAVVLPIDKMVPMLRRYNITVLIDGAHAVGMVPINITELAPDYYVSSCHKSLYSARGSGLLYVAKEHQDSIHPALITAGYRKGGNFQDEFFWTGTMDYAPYMTIPAALQFRQEAGGEERIMEYTRNLARRGGRLMATRFVTQIMQDPDQIGYVVDVRLPLNNPEDPRLTSAWWVDEQLYKHMETYATVYKHNGHWWVRGSAQIYNDISDFAVLADHFKCICDEVNSWENDTSQSFGFDGNDNDIFLPY